MIFEIILWLGDHTMFQLQTWSLITPRLSWVCLGPNWKSISFLNSQEVGNYRGFYTRSPKEDDTADEGSLLLSSDAESNAGGGGLLKGSWWTWTINNNHWKRTLWKPKTLIRSFNFSNKVHWLLFSSLESRVSYCLLEHFYVAVSTFDARFGRVSPRYAAGLWWWWRSSKQYSGERASQDPDRRLLDPYSMILSIKHFFKLTQALLG